MQRSHTTVLSARVQRMNRKQKPIKYWALEIVAAHGGNLLERYYKYERNAIRLVFSIFNPCLCSCSISVRVRAKNRILFPRHERNQIYIDITSRSQFYIVVRERLRFERCLYVQVYNLSVGDSARAGQNRCTCT